MVRPFPPFPPRSWSNDLVPLHQPGPGPNELGMEAWICPPGGPHSNSSVYLLSIVSGVRSRCDARSLGNVSNRQINTRVYSQNIGVRRPTSDILNPLSAPFRSSDVEISTSRMRIPPETYRPPGTSHSCQSAHYLCQMTPYSSCHYDG